MSEPLRSFPATVRKVLFGPRAFFRDMSRTDSLWNPLVFAVVCALISLPLTYLAAPFDPFSETGEGLGGLFAGIGGHSSAAVAALVLVVLLLAPLFVVLGLYVGSAIYQVLVAIFVGRGNAGFDATLRIYAYTGATNLLTWLPVLGYAAGLYGLVLVFLGVKEVHDTTTLRALGVVSGPLAFWLFLVFGGPVFRFVFG